MIRGGHWANEEQQAHMRYLASVPPDQRCASGWHVMARESCDCNRTYGFGSLAERNAKDTREEGSDADVV